jgi:hypothetical protein
MKTTLYKTLIFSYILLFAGTLSYGQKKSRSSSSSFPYKWGVGLKLGDPTGLSVKRYIGNKALELVLGRAYYYDSYYGYYQNHDPRYRDNNYYYGPGPQPYKGPRVYGFTTPLSLQFRYLIHKNINDLQGLRWYYGFGAQARTITYYYYDYNYDAYGNYVNYYSNRVTDFSFGGDGILGLEYTFDDLPLSIFADVNLYMEFYRRPFYPEGQGGIGIRYNFK